MLQAGEGRGQVVLQCWRPCRGLPQGACAAFREHGDCQATPTRDGAGSPTCWAQLYYRYGPVREGHANKVGVCVALAKWALQTSANAAGMMVCRCAHSCDSRCQPSGTGGRSERGRRGSAVEWSAVEGSAVEGSECSAVSAVQSGAVRCNAVSGTQALRHSGTQVVVDGHSSVWQRVCRRPAARRAPPWAWSRV